MIPIAAALVSLVLLHRFQMTREDHAMIRAALAAKHKYGAVKLTEAQIARIEAVSGQKFADTWLAEGSDGPNAKMLETDEDGNFAVLTEEA